MTDDLTRRWLEEHALPYCECGACPADAEHQLPAAAWAHAGGTYIAVLPGHYPEAEGATDCWRVQHEGYDTIEHADELPAAAGHAAPAATQALTPAPDRRKWKLKWGQWIGPPECPDIHRWVLEAPWCSLRLHHFVHPDYARHPHDHPWPFVTLVLRGGYTDVSYDEHGREVEDRLRPGSVRYRPAMWTHRVVTHNAWTLVLTGPIVRAWGFLVGSERRHEQAYFDEWGFPPCADMGRPER